MRFITSLFSSLCERAHGKNHEVDRRLSCLLFILDPSCSGAMFVSRSYPLVPLRYSPSRDLRIRILICSVRTLALWDPSFVNDENVLRVMKLILVRRALEAKPKVLVTIIVVANEEGTPDQLDLSSRLGRILC